MHLHIITVLPELLESPFAHSILKRAQQKGLVSIDIYNLREFSSDKHKSVDDYAFGGGAGMVMMAEPIVNCLEHIQSKGQIDEVIYMSPDGELFDQPMANRLSLKKSIVLLCGHYKGVDQRIRDPYVTREISLVDYELSGGELVEVLVSDEIIRSIPGLLNDHKAALHDYVPDHQFSQSALLPLVTL